MLSAVRLGGAPFEQHEVDVLGTLARSSAAAIANAIDFERERRIARSLTRGFVPDSLPELTGYEVGLLYEPAARQPAGGDLYGAWALPRGEVARAGGRRGRQGSRDRRPERHGALLHRGAQLGLRRARPRCWRRPT